MKIEELLLTKDKEETSTMQEKLEKKLHDLERKHSIIQKGIQEIDLLQARALIEIIKCLNEINLNPA